MKTVLLTGATGYIGQFAISRLLEKKYIVHAVTSKPINVEPIKNLAWHQTNLLDFEETTNLIRDVQPTHLLSFAWYVEHGKFWNSTKNIDWLEASLNLAKQFEKNSGQRIVVAGTCAEYDWAEKSPFKEHKTPLSPQTLYGAAKTALAQTLERFAEVSGFSFASGKIFFPFGANESPNRLIPSVINSLLRGEPAKTSHGQQIRDFMFVEDLAEAFAALLESEVSGAVNIATGRGVKLKKIIETIAEIIGKPELLRIGALAAREDEPPEIVADITRLRNEVGFNKEFNLRESLENTVDWWKKEL